MKIIWYGVPVSHCADPREKVSHYYLVQERMDGRKKISYGDSSYNH
jgi:hypothetical protein